LVDLLVINFKFKNIQTCHFQRVHVVGTHFFLYIHMYFNQSLSLFLSQICTIYIALFVVAHPPPLPHYSLFYHSNSNTPCSTTTRPSTCSTNEYSYLHVTHCVVYTHDYIHHVVFHKKRSVSHQFLATSTFIRR